MNERLEELFATWHHLVQTHAAGHEVHRELDAVIQAVFNEIDKGADEVVGSGLPKLNKSYASALRDFQRNK